MKWIGQHIWDFISRFRSDVYLEKLAGDSSTDVLVIDSNNKICVNSAMSGDLTSIVAGTGLSGTNLTGPIPTLNADASTSSSAGIIEIAVTAEVTTGTDTTRAITPKGLNDGYEGTSNIDTVGTILNGTWRGTPIQTAYIGDDQVTEDKLADTLLAEIDANTDKLTFPTGITYASEVLTVGDDDNGTATITRKTHSDEAGGRLTVQGGDATGTNKTGGGLVLEAGRGTGSAVGGSIQFMSSAAGGSATTLRTNVEIAAFDNVGNLQIDGDLTVTGNDIKDSGGNSIISSNGSGVVTMAGGNILVDGTNANLTLNEGSDLILEADNAGGGLASSIQYNSSTGNKIMLGATSDVVVLCNRTLNGTVEIRANAAAGSGGEVTVATFADTEITLAKDLIANRRFTITSNTDGRYDGDVVYFGGTTSMTIGRIYNYKSDGTWEIANADAVATSDGLLAVALGAASDTNGMLLRGMVTLDHDPGAVGDVLYVQSDNAGTLGHATVTAPSASGDCVRIVGYCLNASNGQIWFNPDSTFVEIA